MRRLLRLGFWLGVLAGGAWAAQRLLGRRDEHAPAPRVAPVPPAPVVPVVAPDVVEVGDVDRPGEPEVATVQAGADAPWVDPLPDGTCPPTHPVKAKLSSRIFHLPGMLAYERTKPDRCYRDEASAEADGLRKAKR